jgi:hypothetical protein
MKQTIDKNRKEKKRKGKVLVFTAYLDLRLQFIIEILLLVNVTHHCKQSVFPDDKNDPK